MNREAPVETIALLGEILATLREISGKLDREPAPPADPLVVEIHAFIGGLAKFSAADLIKAADPQLAEALGDLDAYDLGRILSANENREVNGQRLTREGRGVDGNVWSFR